MGKIDVGSVVASILAAFNSSLHVFDRLGGKKRKSHARLPRPSEEEEWLETSLKGRPSEIRHQYDQHVSKHGRRFEAGDDTAHTSLAHTLLVLNTGLINLLNHALSRDSKSKATSRRALFNLSETAAMDTLSALGQLHSRLSLHAPISSAREHHSEETTKHHRRKRRERHSSSVAPNRPHPSPLLANGGWIRSKSGSSVVSRAEARRARNLDDEEHDRSKSSPSLLKAAMSQTDLIVRKHETGSDIPKHSERSDKSRYDPTKSASPHNPMAEPRPQRQPSMLLVSSEFFENHPSPGEHTVRLQKAPHTRPKPRTGVRPTSTATFLTTSTKIGEIPESKWHDRVLSPEEQASRKMPYTIPPLLEATEPKRRGKGFKFWKREEKGQEIPAY